MPSRGRGAQALFSATLSPLGDVTREGDAIVPQGWGGQQGDGAPPAGLGSDRCDPERNSLTATVFDALRSTLA